MKTFVFISRSRGIYLIEEYRKVEATNLTTAETELRKKVNGDAWRYTIFSITK